jgi:hypothetical protein
MYEKWVELILRKGNCIGEWQGRGRALFIVQRNVSRKEFFSDPWIEPAFVAPLRIGTFVTIRFYYVYMHIMKKWNICNSFVRSRKYHTLRESWRTEEWVLQCEHVHRNCSPHICGRIRGSDLTWAPGSGRYCCWWQEGVSALTQGKMNLVHSPTSTYMEPRTLSKIQT